MDAIGVIPARFGSTRFPGKVLADILGRPMIQWVWEGVKKAHSLDDLVVATDDEKVLRAVEGFGGKAILTSTQHRTGTDRICEVVNPLDVKVVVNIQGDEPMLDSSMVDDLARTLLENPEIQMATLMHPIASIDELKDPNVVKVVTDKDGFALYFSRAPIPYLKTRRRTWRGQAEPPSAEARGAGHRAFKHIGMYAYTKDFLFTFANLSISALEEAEALEQLRALEHGHRIKVVETKYDSIGVDTPKDLERVRKLLAKKPYEFCEGHNH